MPENRDRDLFLFLCAAFFLPIPALWLETLAGGGVLKLLCYGLRAASPSIAAIAVAAKNSGLSAFFSRHFRTRRILAACVLPAILALVPMCLAKLAACVLLKERFALWGVPPAQVLTISWALVAEELGWRGYLHPFLWGRMKHRGFAPLAVGAVWGLWHYHYFLFDGMQAPLVWFFIGCAVESYLYGWLLQRCDHNLLSAMTYHFFWNLWFHVFALNPADNGGSPAPYILLTAMEALLCTPLFLRACLASQHDSD